MKVFHFLPSWSLGGAERVVQELIDNYPVGIQSTIVTFKILERTDTCENIIILKSGHLRKYFSFLKFVLINRPDVIHAHMTPCILHLVLLRIINRKIKIIYTVHNDFRKPMSAALNLLYFLFYTKCNIKTVCVSYSTFGSFKEYLKIPQIVIHNGISVKKVKLSQMVIEEINSLKATPSTKVFLSVTRIVPQKNLELLINAFKMLDNNHDVLLLIIGYDPAPDQSELNKLKKELPENIKILGPRVKVQEYLQMADASCLSSLTEPFSMALLESLSFGVPVISTNVGGVPEAITHNETGFLCPDFTVDSYVDTLKKFLGLSNERLSQIKRNAIARYNENFTTEKMVDKYMTLYKDEY